MKGQHPRGDPVTEPARRSVAGRSPPAAPLIRHPISATLTTLPRPYRNIAPVCSCHIANHVALRAPELRPELQLTHACPECPRMRQLALRADLTC